MPAEMVRGVVKGSTVVDATGAVIGSPLWPVNYSPQEGDAVVGLADRGLVYIIGPAYSTPRADTGTVAGTPSGGLLPVTSGSTTYSARYQGTAPGVGSLVMLAWTGTTPWVVGVAAAVGTAAPSTAPVPTAPPVSSSGTLYLAAIDSGSWRSSDGWGNSGSRPLSTATVAQGTYGTQPPYSGAWFYGQQAGQLSGATITGFHFRLPARLSIGSYNSALAVHLYLHTSPNKPSGDVSRTAGPADVTIPGGYGGGWVDLPVGWAATLVAGGGIGIYGSPYLGLQGIDADPASGQFALDWSR